MIRITLEKNDSGISFDIDTHFRTAILGENGIGKTSILESIAARSSKHDWLSVHVPSDVRIAFFSQIETNKGALSGGEHTKERLKTLFSEKADLYVLDEPTNHLDVMTQLVLRDAFLKYSGALILVSHDKKFLEEQAFIHIGL